MVDLVKKYLSHYYFWYRVVKKFTDLSQFSFQNVSKKGFFDFAKNMATDYSAILIGSFLCCSYTMSGLEIILKRMFI